MGKTSSHPVDLGLQTSPDALPMLPSTDDTEVPMSPTNEIVKSSSFRDVVRTIPKVVRKTARKRPATHAMVITHTGHTPVKMKLQEASAAKKEET